MRSLLSYKLWLIFGRFGFLCLEIIMKVGVVILVGIIDSNY